MQQVRDMEKFGIGYDVVVFLDVDKEEVIKRLTKRGRTMINQILYLIELHVQKRNRSWIDYFKTKACFISIIKAQKKNFDIAKDIIKEIQNEI